MNRNQIMSVCRFVLILVFLLSSYGSIAQSDLENTSEKKASKIAAQLQLGVPGVGIGLRYKALPRLGIKAGVLYAKAQVNNKIKIDDLSTTNWIKGDLTLISLTGEYNLVPWFRMVLGGGYVFNTGLSANLTPNQDLDFGSYSVEKSDTGDLTASASYSGFSPYVGLGFGRGIPKKRFNVCFDIGTFYLNSPKVDIHGTKIFKANNENTESLQNNLKDYRWLPVLMINLNFKI